MPMLPMRPGLNPKMAGMDTHAAGMGFNGFHPGQSDAMPSPPYAGPPADMPPPQVDPRAMAAHQFGGGGPMPHPMAMAPQGPPPGMPMGPVPMGPPPAPMGFGGDMGAGGHFGGLGATMQMLKARRMAANGFGDRPSSQGSFGPGMDGKPGGMTPTLGRSFVANGFRTEA